MFEARAGNATSLSCRAVEAAERMAGRKDRGGDGRVRAAKLLTLLLLMVRTLEGLATCDGSGANGNGGWWNCSL